MRKVSGSEKGGLRLYKNSAARRKGVSMLKKFGFNYFVGFQDVHKFTPAGLSYGKAQWVKEGQFYEKDI